MRHERTKRFREIGEMRLFVTLEQPSRSGDAYGGASVSWSTYAQAWAKIEPYRGRQEPHGDAPEKHVTHRITMRYNDISALTNQMRVSYNNGTTTRLFQIHWFRDIEERNLYMELYCEEGSPS